MYWLVWGEKALIYKCIYHCIIRPKQSQDYFIFFLVLTSFKCVVLFVNYNICDMCLRQSFTFLRVRHLVYGISITERLKEVYYDCSDIKDLFYYVYDCLECIVIKCLHHVTITMLCIFLMIVYCLCSAFYL